MLNKIKKQWSRDESIIQFDQLISVLPELYQPIFGHASCQDMTVSRECLDRLAPITQLYQALESQLNRPLRVLDLGCAQGYFSFSLAKLGATVHGVDYLEANIAVCQALARQYPELKTSFQTGRVEDILTRLVPEQYDLVLGLSVFHHIVHDLGIASVQNLMFQFADKITAGVFEMALASEPVYWGKSQPENPRQLLESFSFVHELSQHKTHLSSLTRPLYMASNRYWYLSGQAGAFERWQTDSHELAAGNHQKTRRYFFGNGYIIKVYDLDHKTLGDANLQEYCNETHFLENPPPHYGSPRLLLHGRHKNEAWLVRECLPGQLLLDIIQAGKPYDSASILKAILEQLAMLESKGLFHSDVRTWNVLVDAEGVAKLIDYGAISKEQKDCGWPYDVFLSFFIFVYEISMRHVGSQVPLRTVALSPYRLESPYREWALRFWSYPSTEWRFSLMLQLFRQINAPEYDSFSSENLAMYRWMKAVEEAMNTQMHFAQRQVRIMERIAVLEQKVRYSLFERIIRNLREYYVKKRKKNHDHHRSPA